MEEKDFLLYLEETLKELNYPKAVRFNIEGTLIKNLKKYSLEEIKETVENPTFHFTDK